MSDEKNPPVNLISMRMRGHASPSGYDRLADFIDAPVIQPVSQWTFVQRAVARSFRFLINRSGSQWYHRDSFYSELHAARQWFRKRGQIFHFLYGENSHRYLGCLKLAGQRNSIVCTYHTPPDKFQIIVQDKNHLARIDAVIVVSNSQTEFFSDLVGPERVFYVPHGIDVDYFKPFKPKDKDVDTANILRCLFVGRHLRDFDTLARTAELLASSGNTVRFSVVASPKVHFHFTGMKNIELHTGISDEKLLELYQESDILVLPLLDCTANNSLLEAMACGLPIISTDLPGVRDYVNEACALLTPKGDPQALAEAILYLQKNKVLRQRMANASRDRAQDFSWQKVASRVREVYARVSTCAIPLES
jgi:glycosyltransferase involved in cell wall biosynthesis